MEEPNPVRVAFDRLLGPDSSAFLLRPWQELDLARLGRVLMHSILVGAGAGIVACAFFYLLEGGQWLVLERLAHHHIPRPGSEASLFPSTEAGPVRWWLLALVPMIGGLFCGLLVHFFAPEAAGPGGDAYIDAFHHKKGTIRDRVPLVKALASLLTISSGGSAGREGPTMQICAGLASALGRRLQLSEQERRILLVAGAAAGTGAIFQTPLGGALYAVEVLYRDDFETDAIVPSILASVTAYSIFTMFYGQSHLLDTAASYAFIPTALPLYAALGLGLSLVGVTFVKIRHNIQDRIFGPIERVPRWILPAIGGAAVGLLGIFVPQALGTGYGYVQGAISGADWIPPGSGGPLLLLGLAGAKILATSLTLGSGGSGGEFGPSLVIGGLVGGALGLVFHGWFPGVVPDPGAFALVGMASMFGGIAHVPVSSLIMVCELAGSYDLLVPLMLCEGIAFVLLRRVAIYRKQVPNRMSSPAHRDEMIFDVLESIQVEHVMRRGESLPAVPSSAKLDEVMRVMATSNHPAILVEAQGGQPGGLISLAILQSVLHDHDVRPLTVAADLATPLPPISPADDLHASLRAFWSSGTSALPITNTMGEAVGILTLDEVTRAYDRAVKRRLVRE